MGAALGSRRDTTPGMPTAEVETSRSIGTVIVTGAGRGLGRTFALDLARCGARVVINDIDGAAAAAVAEECRAAGADAVADDSSIGSPDAARHVIEAALEAFGSVEAVVANAGIIRDRTIAKLSDDDIDRVIEVNLRGNIDIARAVWPFFRARRYGRLVFITSAAGILGNLGQANSSAAKAGLIGLTRMLALEGEHGGVLANAVAPMAKTDMAGDFFGPIVEQLAPEQVAPVVTYLCGPSCAVTGEVFAAGGGLLTRFEVRETRGARFAEQFNALDVERRIGEIVDVTDAQPATSLHAHMQRHTEGVPS